LLGPKVRWLWEVIPSASASRQRRQENEAGDPTT
jgi:hypothetical protein